MMNSFGPDSDRLAIRELVESYNDAVMCNDADAWAANWADDGEWIVHDERIAGRDAILATWKSHMAAIEFLDFFSNPGFIQVDGDQARGRWWQQERLYFKTGEKRGASARYDDLYVKRNGRWFFKRRTFTVLDTRPINPGD
jgi:uncharacterized protein (TIGR02246 family)